MMTFSQIVSLTWKWDPLALATIVVGTVLWVRYRRARSWPRTLAFAGAALALALALSSPISTLADGYLFSAHMTQHLLLMLVVPPLALLAVGGGASAALPPARRRLPAVVAWGLGVGAMWLWHARSLCNAAAVSTPVHRVQEVSLLAMGTAFWWPILAPNVGRRIAPLLAVVYLFAACTACTILGIALALSPVEVCSRFAMPTDDLGILPTLRGAWGLTPDRDQQLGGLLMWVPACLVYITAIMGTFRRFYRDDAAVEAS